MREKIAGMIRRHGDARIGVNLYGSSFEEYTEPQEMADQILTLLREEIEKVENPYPITGRYHKIAHDTFEGCRRKILTLLQGD